jgi:hypothetical protein
MKFVSTSSELWDNLCGNAHIELENVQQFRFKPRCYIAERFKTESDSEVRI